MDPQQQDYSLTLYHLLKTLDKTRLVVGNDGWEMTKSDLCAIHCYDHGNSGEEKKIARFEKQFATLEDMLQIRPGGRSLYANGFEYGGEPIVVSECGGVSFACEKESGWGYTQVSGQEEFIATYLRIVNTIFASGHVCGYCYTQLTDVEQEINGLLTADRRFKVDAGAIKALNDGL